MDRIFRVKLVHLIIMNLLMKEHKNEKLPVKKMFYYRHDDVQHSVLFIIIGFITFITSVGSGCSLGSGGGEGQKWIRKKKRLSLLCESVIGTIIASCKGESTNNKILFSAKLNRVIQVMLWLRLVGDNNKEIYYLTTGMSNFCWHNWLSICGFTKLIIHDMVLYDVD